MLKKLVKSKKNELCNSDRSAGRSTRPKRNPGPRLSAICAALKYPEDEEEELSEIASCHDQLSQMDYEEDSAEEGSVTEPEETVQWVLFNAVKNAKNSLGQGLADPFLKLPNRRFYPDYYEEIHHPMAMMQIRKKIRQGKYSCLEELSSDFELMFRNAQQYNTDESRIYKDAVRLQKIMRTKKKELEKLEMKEVLEDLPSYDLEKEVHGSEDEEEQSATVTVTPKPEKERKKPGRKPLPYEEALKKRINVLYDTVFNFQEENRSLIDIFIELPSKKEYPDYYQVISEPIDMNTIKTKIMEEKYTTEQALIADLKLMFSNARHYNEESSLVYQDSQTLERVLKQKIRNLTPLSPPSKQGQKNRPKSKSLSPLAQKLQQVYDIIANFTDSRGRVLCPPFMKLPSRLEYPNYYEVIKKPIDMQHIFGKMTNNKYESLEDLVSDFVLMFDNACKFNEPDSLIYKDALTLQRVCLEKKGELQDEEDDNEVPDVKAVVLEMMTNLFISVYNYQDEEGRCYSDSFAELPSKEVAEQEGEQPVVTVKPLTFDQIKRNLDRGRYRRLDRFQEDMFEVFSYARKVSRTDSQLYEDAVEMQMFFIKIRDELCKNGELLLTPALSYTEKHLQSALDEEKQEKLPKEMREDEEKKQAEETNKKEQEKEQEDIGENSVSYGGQTYSVGDFVYIEPREKGLEPHIVCIERLSTEPTGENFLYGCWFCRPNETYHLATRKFLEKEVFRSDFSDRVPLNIVLGKCFVMFVKDYFKMKPEGFPDKDVYVCESRYSAKHKAFKKIKIWQVPRNESVKIVPREQMLTTVRVASVFAEKMVGGKEDIGDDGQPFLLDKRRSVVIQEVATPEEGITYYEQFIAPNGCFKLDDHVYVKTEREMPIIVKIDKMWADQRGAVYIQGPKYLYPLEVEHPPTRLFFRREVFHSDTEPITYSLANIVGKCAVLFYKEFCTSRPTEYPEKDVYVCESKYVEAEKTIRKMSKSSKKITLSPKVTDDEIYFFRKSITPKKVPSPHLLAAVDEPADDMASEMTEAPPSNMDEDSMMEHSFSYNTSFDELHARPATPSSASVEGKPAKKVQKRNRKPTGYIIYAAEVRKKLKDQHPDYSFGELSKVVGNNWKSLPDEEKRRYEEKAKKQAEINDAKRAAEAEAQAAQSPVPGYRTGSPGVAGHGQMTPGMYPQQHMQGYPPGYPQQQQRYPNQMPPPQGMQPMHGMQYMGQGNDDDDGNKYSGLCSYIKEIVYVYVFSYHTVDGDCVSCAQLA
ncbi:protein polybromo-1-like [Lingula anatina]|uniref:Protein polybromo-1-like n=1 Tax=Lingula anatina TaxID=7574 RepID=A0A1S3IY77_LINAN|nr:protein polybromo-1-like [Lingula anatina]|eukprot:XP_013402941.2 protein polybromo-1-like [Lingula anatina]